MNSVSEPSAADLCDRHQRRTALVALGAAIIYASSALELAMGSESHQVLEYVRLAMVATIFALVIPTMVWKFRKRPGSQNFCKFKKQSYVAEIFRRAQGISWGATLLVLVVLSNIAERTNGLSGQLYLETALATMLAVFSLVFLALYRSER